MALESLLTSLKSSVTHVTAVQASNYKAFGCNGTAPAGVSDVTPIAVQADSVTAVTCEDSRALQRKPASIQACTSVTAVTSEKAKAESEAQKVGASGTANTSWGWLLHYPASDPVTVYCLPEPTHAEVLAMYPEAIAAEPLPERYAVTATLEQEAELRVLVASIAAAHGFRPAEREEALAGALRDPDNALRSFRALAAEAGVMPEPFPDDRRTCNQCARLTRSGKCLEWQAVGARRGYEPVRDILRRCGSFRMVAHDGACHSPRSGQLHWMHQLTGL